MEETLTSCLVRVREDLNELKKVRNYLDNVGDTEESCFITWRTVEAFNSILAVCSSQNTPETDALDTLLDSFYHLTKNNSDDRVWEDFGFELGIICVKVLSAIDRSEIFEILFCKLLSVIGLISRHNSNVWKMTARQILNVFINKKVSLSYLETILKLYISVLKHVDGSTLRDFSIQNLHLLKTLSLLVQQVGDFEIQSYVIEIIFLHFSRDSKNLSNFLSMGEKNFFLSFNFECNCRLYLNELNNQKGLEKKVYSICCHVLYFGGNFVEPPNGRDFFWVDANKGTERLTIKCGDTESCEDRVISVAFSDIVTLEFKNDKSGGNRCLTIGTKSSVGLEKDGEHDDICLVVENVKEVLEFVSFLKGTIGERKGKQKSGKKESKTIDCLLIDRSSPRKDVQDNVITTSERPEIDQIFSDGLTLFEKTSPAIAKTSQTSLVPSSDRKPFKEQKEVQESQKMSPSSFAESLEKHIGLGSSEQRYPFEDSVETMEFLPKATPGGHKLFRGSQNLFSFEEKEEPEFNLNFARNSKEKNKLTAVAKEPNVRTYSRKSRDVKPTTVSNEQNNLEVKLSNTQSEDYFQACSNVLKKKKPSLPKLKRSTREMNFEEKARKGKCKASEGEKEKKLELKSKKSEEQQKNQEVDQFEFKAEIIRKSRENQEEVEEQKKKSEPKAKSISRTKISNNKKEEKLPKAAKPSLLDPKGYTYKRWCKPTTSERSNFWLKKLNVLEKPKTDLKGVFDFSEDSADKIRKRKRVVHSKRKCVTKGKSTTFRQLKEILRNSTATKEKPNTSENERQEDSESPEERFQPFVDSSVLDLPESKSCSPVGNTESEKENNKSQQRTAIRERSEEVSSKSPEERFKPFVESSVLDLPESKSCSPVGNTESEKENNKFQQRTAKRERSEEDSSAAKRYVKKKTKTSLPKTVLSSFRRRIRKTEQKDRQYTDEIIQAVNDAVSHAFNHFQRKDGERVRSYLNAAEATSTALATEIEELNLRAKRIQKAIFYFKESCSVSDFCESLNGHFTKMKNALRDWKEKKDASITTERIKDRLSDLIKTEIDRSIKSEWATKQKKLSKTASILGIDFKIYV